MKYYQGDWNGESRHLGGRRSILDSSYKGAGICTVSYSEPHNWTPPHLGSRSISDYLDMDTISEPEIHIVSGIINDGRGAHVMGIKFLTRYSGLLVGRHVGSRYHSNIKNIRTSSQTYPYTLFNISNYLIG